MRYNEIRKKELYKRNRRKEVIEFIFNVCYNISVPYVNMMIIINDVIGIARKRYVIYVYVN